MSNTEESPLVKMIGAGLLLTCYATYHFLGTENKTITARVKSKHTETRLVRRNKRTRIETDHFIDTDVGTLRDEEEIFEGKFLEGKIYHAIKPDVVCDFEVNYDKVFGGRNILNVTNCAPASATSLTPGEW